MNYDPDSSIEVLQRQRRLFSFFTSKEIPPVPLEDERSRFVNIYLIFTLFFFWVDPVLKTGYKRTIKPNDLPYLSEELKVETRFVVFERYFNKYIRSFKDSQIVVKDILKILFMTFKWEYSLALCSAIISSSCSSCLPLLTKLLIKYVTAKANGESKNLSEGFVYIISALCLMFLIFFLSNVQQFYSGVTSIGIKSVLTKAILSKSFRVDNKGLHKFPPSKLITLITADLNKLDVALSVTPQIAVAPLSFTIAIVILSINLGISTVVALGIIIMMSFLFGKITKSMFNTRKKSIKFTEQRVGLLKEIIDHLKTIKYYSWEESYKKKVTDARVNESNEIFSLQRMRSLLFIVLFSINPISSVSTILVLYAIDGDKRTPANIFSSLSLFSLLGNVFVTLPFSVSAFLDGLISLKRIFQFLVSGETSIYENIIKDDVSDFTIPVIEVRNATIEWENPSDDLPTESGRSKGIFHFLKFKKSTFVPPKSSSYGSTDEDNSTSILLRAVNFKVNKGELIFVVGSTGSGKTSLLKALSGFMKVSSGTIHVRGTTLLCGASWVQNATIKENILFGNEFDRDRYETVVDACGLRQDLNTFLDYDNTEVGERGITLSGGQRARLNLARAIYHDADNILLDDVLSAVDAKVGKHIMNHAILRLLSEKTRFIVTHQLSYLEHADKIIYIAGDGTIDFGSLTDLRDRNKAFEKFLLHRGNDHTISGKEDETIETPNPKKNDPVKMRESAQRKLMEDEVSAENVISWKVYKSFLELGAKYFPPVVMTILILLITITTTFSGLFINVWLSFWLDKRFDKPDGFYIGFYIFITVSYITLLLAQFNIYVRVIVVASRWINIAAIKRIIHVPMSFMDTTPLGRILNRLTKDTDVLDTGLVENIRLGLYMTSQLFGVLTLSIIYLPWLSVAIPCLGLIVIIVGSYYQASSRELKRLESTQRSFYVSNFTEVLNGLDTLKAFDASSRFLLRNDVAVNKTNEAALLVNGVQRWTAIRVSLIALVYLFIITTLCINNVFTISPASLGLVISYIFSIPNLLVTVVRTFVLMENDMTSYERIYQYAYELPQEPPYHLAESKPLPDWPQNGRIEFNNVSMRYRLGLPKVLKHVSFQVEGNERIGICGRTGAGKSSIMNALFRLTEPCEGSIFIDGVDISKLGLHELRSKLSIIPQESVLFSGDIRKNLDPFDQFSDELLWESLRRAGLIDPEILEDVKKQSGKNLHKFHLDATVGNDGMNFSLGEKQLIAFARALVRNSKILVLDEATSSVDYETDAKIQKTIVQEFNECTILCIAHRLRTILKYDKILVLDQGEVKEFDTPKNLFDNENSIFRLLCDKSKITSVEFL